MGFLSLIVIIMVMRMVYGGGDDENVEKKTAFWSSPSVSESVQLL